MSWHLAIGIVLGTAFLLAAAVAWYDLMLYCFLSIGILQPATPLTQPINLWGQIIFVATLTWLATCIAWYFEPFNATKRVSGEDRPIRDTADVTRITPALLGVSTPTIVPAVAL